MWKRRRSTDKRYPGDNRLILPRVHIDGMVWHLDVGSSHPGAGVGPKGWAVRPLKAVRELGSERRETVRSLSVVGVGNLRGAVLVREDRDGRINGVPVVTPVA